MSNITTTIICPRCSAPVGQPCMTASGNVARNLHVTRTAHVEDTTPAPAPAADTENTTPAPAPAPAAVLVPEAVANKTNWDAGTLRHIMTLLNREPVTLTVIGGHRIPNAELVGIRTNYVIPQLIAFGETGDTHYYDLDKVHAITTNAITIADIHESKAAEHAAAIDRAKAELPDLAQDPAINWAAASELEKVMVSAAKPCKHFGNRIPDTRAVRYYSPHDL